MNYNLINLLGWLMVGFGVVLAGTTPPMKEPPSLRLTRNGVHAFFYKIASDDLGVIDQHINRGAVAPDHGGPENGVVMSVNF